MCGIVVHYAMCRHTTKQKIPCDPKVIRSVSSSLHNTYNEMHHGTCPKCIHYITTPDTPTIHNPDQKLSDGLPRKETGDIKDALLTQGKKTMGSFKRLVRSVSQRALNGKSSEEKLTRSVGKKTLFRTGSRGKLVKRQPESFPETVEVASAAEVMTSEQLAEQYRSLLDVHPSLQDADPGSPPSPSLLSLDIETSTTWSRLISAALGTAGSEAWRKGWFAGPEMSEKNHKEGPTRAEGREL